MSVSHPTEIRRKASSNGQVGGGPHGMEFLDSLLSHDAVDRSRGGAFHAVSVKV